LLDTILDAALVQAYRETAYQVQGPAPFTLQVGQASAALAAAHHQHGVDCSAFITACNPFSRRLDDAANADRHAALGRELRQRGLPSQEGLGRHPSGDWPGETSHLVLGLARDEACALGRALEQNAILWAAADAVPQLILLR